MKSTIFAAFLIGCGGGSFDSSFGGSLHDDAGDAEPSSSGGAAGIASEAGEAASGGRTEAGDAGSGGSLEADAGSGGASSSGGAPSAGGAVATGGVTTGGAPAAGGALPCELVTHDNGYGQTWQDCVPYGTWNLEQAMKACEASGATLCFQHLNTCGVGEWVHGREGGKWGYSGAYAGTTNCQVADLWG